MERTDSLKLNTPLVLYIIFFMGAAGFFIKELTPLFETLTPYVLLGTGVLVIADSRIYQDKQFSFWIILTYILIFLIEIAGESTGLIFGSYNYGNVLGLRVFGVPLIIGFNWLMILLSSFALASSFSLSKRLLVILTPLFAVIMDLLMEPVAVMLGFWKWENGIIPVQNYIAWFLISTAVASGLIYLNLKFKKSIFINYYFSLLIFFLILNLV